MCLRCSLEKEIHWQEQFDRLVQKHRTQQEQAESLYDLWKNQKTTIVQQVINGEYTWQIPKKTYIPKPGSTKKRIVYRYSLKDRLVLGVMYRAFQEYHQNKISNQCFSYKKRTSTNIAIKFINDKLKERGNELKFYTKIDIQSYFNSVQREKVASMINELFYGGIRDTVQKLMLDNKVLDGEQIINEWKSLIPGCALSSFFANYSLSDCDRYFESQDKHCIYARYSDDIVIITRNKDDADKYILKLESYLEDCGLKLNKNKFKQFWIKNSLENQVEFLGLRITSNGNIDIQNHAKVKIKNRIRHYCKVERKKIEKGQSQFNKSIKRVIRKINHKNFKCAINHGEQFGWCSYAFPKIDTIESLIEIDFYMRDSLRALKTGKHNKANIRAISDSELIEFGWVSLVDLYKLYKADRDYYLEVIELI